ncbi:PEP-CTERM sorting domain-containing protein [Janthinobacterium lividum]|uniref:Npun_F0296 family exosortase-dependent surface protein n=1 Tax=Janthinobacterium TaxID=29580 RepID=UPI000C0EDE58|nr:MULTISPECIES: PEP-CTERM sorting domain-containing protein [Janthinobacterium]PHV19278.1 PEP-CTERM sorting domain-containing protein [Janthinobacterium sp. BJB446]QKY01550.1 PEP-CTERM sorting domain-containing protein [Janthinobacterium lividum]
MKILTTLALATLTVAAGTASAVPTFTAGGTALAGEGLVTSVAGATTINFNDGLLPGNYTGAVFTSNHPSYAAQPPNDLTAFYSVGVSDGQITPGTATFSGGLSYFGFYMGSPDTYNSIVFTMGDSSTVVLTGSQMAALGSVSPNGDQSVGLYINAWAGQGASFTSVAFHSPNTNAFESDNHAYIAAVPEPGTYAMLLAGLGLLGFMLRRKAS